MKKIILIFIIINLFCYNHPNQSKPNKPLWVKQYDQRNQKEQKQKAKKQKLKMTETKIKFKQEKLKYDKRK